MRQATLASRSNGDTESGFTLIELLVVILIIGIIATIAVSMFLNQRKSAVDASLKSDMKNAAMAYTTWRLGDGNTNDKFRQITSAGGYSTFIIGPNSYIHENDPGRPIWNEIEELPELRTSEGNVIEFLVRPNPHSSSWHRAHEEGEFCMRASNPASNYSYVSDSGMGRGSYDLNLFYDSALGGVVEMDDITTALDEGRTTSCYWYGEAYQGAIA